MTDAAAPGTTVVVVAWQGAHLLPACLDAALAQQVPGGLEVLVVDNGSTDGTAELLASRYPQVRVVRSDRNVGFAGGCALALTHVRTGLVALLNTDAVPRAGWLAALVEHLEQHPRCAMVTGKVLLGRAGGDGPVLNSAGGWVDRLGHGRDRGWLQLDVGQYDRAEEVFYAPATACLLRTAAVRGAGGVDPTYFLYHEDVDLGWRLRLHGWTVRYEPAAEVVHEHGASSGAGSASALHGFHDARNRLLTLVKDGPAGTAVAAALRLPVTAVGAAVRRDPARAVVLARAVLSFLRLLPGALVQRQRISRTSTCSRSAVEADRARLAAP